MTKQTVTKQTVTLELEVPKGWEYVEYRIPEADDYVLFIHKLEPEPFSTAWIPIHPCPVYRRVLPDTLTVELPRDEVVYYAGAFGTTTKTLGDAARAALKAEGQS